MSFSGNVGEWSEVYVLLSLLERGSVQIVDEEFRPTGSTLGLVSVERGSGHGLYSYRPDRKTGCVAVVGGGEHMPVTLESVREGARQILEVLQTGTGKITVPEVEQMLAKMRISKLTASSSSKSDIRIIVQDSKTTSRLDLPMSIKSMIGKPPTLLNASGATNFKIEFRCGAGLRNELKSLGRSPKPVMKRLLDEGVVLDERGPVNEVFRSNLQLTDTEMPRLLSALVREFYSGSKKSLIDLVEVLALRDPLGLGDENAARFYTSKMRAFLADVALGMTPSIRWDGRYSASGGYLVARSNGDVVCLYAADRDKFRDYLLANTYLEIGHTSKHGFGQVEDGPDGMSHILLNLQVRFRPDSVS